MGRALRRLAATALLAATMPGLVCPVQAQNSVYIGGLTDVNFGALPIDGTDQPRSQSICAFSGLLGGRYTVTASGSGSGGAFTLQNGGASLPYEVQWATSAGQTSGTNLQPNQPLTGQTMLLSCLLGTPNTSLTVIIRGSATQQATAGNYNGTLTLILSGN